jgi:hypothetical protein
MNDIVVVLLTLAGTTVIALAIDRGVPNMLESAANMLEDVTARVVASLRGAAAKLRERHAQIEALNAQRRTHGGSEFKVVAKAKCNAA